MNNQTEGTGIASRLESVAERLREARTARSGDIVVTLTGSEAGGYTLQLAHGSATVTSSTGSMERVERPLLEVVADSEILRAVLDGEVDAREQYFKGGLLVRGNLRYLSDLALELGILSRPL